VAPRWGGGLATSALVRRPHAAAQAQSAAVAGAAPAHPARPLSGRALLAPAAPLSPPSAQILQLDGMRATTPRIDAPDPSYGTAPPAFALTRALPGAGTEYLVLGLGAGMLGVFSLASGQLVAELFPGIPERAWGDVWVRTGPAGAPRAVALPGYCLGHFSSLAVADAAERAAAGGGAAGCLLLVATPAGGQRAFVFRLELPSGGMGPGAALARA
jgi:hypothetical protein